MKQIALVAALLGSPVYAHHEIVVATSIMPLVAGLALSLLAAIIAIRQRLSRRRPKRDR